MRRASTLSISKSIRGLPNPAANHWEIAAAMAAFGLTTEPWLYLLDQSGRVAYRVEGMFSADEIDRTSTSGIRRSVSF